MKCEKCHYVNQGCQNDKFLQTDSYIEERFYKLCMEKNVRNKLLFDWVDSKGAYVEYTDFSRSDSGNYSRHDYTHSVAILNALVSVLGKDKVDCLNVTDLWMLLHCAYGHDIGMPYSFTQMETFWKDIKRNEEFGKFFRQALRSEDNELKKAALYINEISQKLNVELLEGSFTKENAMRIETEWPAKVYRSATYITMEYVRKNHAVRSKELIEGCELFAWKGRAQIDSRLYKYIAQCCYMHALDRENILDMPCVENDIETDHCHPRFIAYMLRLGDLLDINNNRFSIIDLFHYGKLPENSELHKKKHEAIEHINFTDRVIEITARSDSEEVCQLTSDWFTWIKEEVGFLISHWTAFAPPEIGGCTLSAPITKVYLNDEEFYRMEDCEFHVDKDTLIDLVVGRNLYKTKFDFMKEYIQNALDATKMKFWIDIQNGNQDYFILDETKQKKKNRTKLLPFDFDKIVFKQYALEVICDYQEGNDDEEPDKKRGTVHIEIVDKGIGIDKECIDAISNIGSGWRRRKGYVEYLDVMPKWLKPTGGFGIGMQSGFMITDEIQIESRCENDIKGRKIGLYSERKNGRIEERDYPVKTIGTRIGVDIPYNWFMDVENYKEYSSLKFIMDDIDFMDPLKTMDRITDFIELYLKTILGNPLFPIYIRQRGRKAQSIESFISEIEKTEEAFEWEHRKYKIFHKENIILIWDMELEILCRIELSDKSSDEMCEEWYYKGVRVWTENQEKQNAVELYKYIGNFKIDIMGPSVKECLTVDRNWFKGGFDYVDISNRYARICLGFLVRKGAILTRPLTGRKFMRCMVAYKYLLNEDKQLMCQQLDEIKEDESESLLVRDDAVVYGYKYDKHSGYFERQDVYSVNDMCKRLYLENRLYWGRLDNSYQLDEELRNQIGDSLVWKIDDVESNGILFLLEDLLTKLYLQEVKGNDKEYLGCYNGKTKANSEHVKQVEVFVPKMGQRQIYVTDENYFEQLHVSKIPFYTDEQMQMLQKDGKNIIISPIPAIYSDSDSLYSLKNIDDQEETYFKRITDNRMYTSLIDWVFDYQKIPGVYTREEIEDAYNELVKYIFDKYIKHMLEKTV